MGLDAGSHDSGLSMMSKAVWPSLARSSPRGRHAWCRSSRRALTARSCFRSGLLRLRAASIGSGTSDKRKAASLRSSTAAAPRDLARRGGVT